MSLWDEADEWYCADTAQTAENVAKREASWKRIAYLRSLGRANPLSPDHDTYQQAVNRWFTFALLCIIATAATVMGGWLFVLKAIAISFAVLIATAAFLWTVTVVIPDTIAWLNGG